MSTVKFELITDVSVIQNGISQVGRGIDDLSNKASDFEKTSREAFGSSAKDVSRLGGEIQKGSGNVGEMISELNKVDKAGNGIQNLNTQTLNLNSNINQSFLKLKETNGIINTLIQKELALTEARNRSNNPQSIQRFNSLIAENRRQISTIAPEFNTQMASIQQSSQETEGVVSKVGGAIIGAFSIGAVVSLGKKIIETRAEFQKFEAVLTNTLGSNSAAKTVLQNIQTFASNTPFSVKEVTDAFIKLASINFKPTNDQLTSLGDLAASKGKSLDQLVEGVLDAQSGSFERLKEFNIGASKEGDKLTFTFNEQKTVVKNTSSEIIKYLLSLGELKGVTGGMAAISETLGGKISNLGDNFDALFNNLGESSEGIVALVIDNFNELLGAANDAASKLNAINASLRAGGGKQSFIDNLTGGNGQLVALSFALDDISKSTKSNVDKLLNYNTALVYVKTQFAVGKITAEEYNNSVILIGQSLKATDEQFRNAKAIKQVPGPTKEELEKAKKALKDYNDFLLDIFKRAQAAETSGLSGLERINREKEIADKELQQLQETLLKKQALAGKGNQLSAEQQEQFNQLQLAIDRKYGADTLALDIQLSEQKAQLRLKDFQNRKKDADDAKAFSDLQTEIRIEEINALKKPQGLSDEDFEKQKSIAILEIKKQAAADQLKVRIEQVRAETGLLVTQANNEASILEAKGDAESLAQAERLRDSANQIQVSGDEQEKLLKLQTEKLINGLSKEIEDINNSDDLGKIDWGKVFGLSEKDKENIGKIGDQLKSIAQGFLDSQNEKLDNELELIEKGREARQNEIDDIESKLQQENALRDAGYANNAAQLDQQLADKKRAQDEDLENTKKLQKEKERLRKQQLLLDQAQQASSLVTAIAEIYASTASAGPFGVAIAAITIGAMLGAFAYAQGRASAAVNAADSSFWKGGYVGDGDKYEEMGTVHGGEFVTTKEKTKKHRTLLEGLHSGDHNMIRIGISDLLKDTGVGLMGDIPGQLNLTKQALKQSEINLMLKSNNEGMEKRIDNLGSKFDKVVSALNNSEVVLPNGNRIIKKGDLTTIIKPNGN